MELCAGPVARNRLTRGVSYLSFPLLPSWLFRWFFRAHWCDVRMERIAGVRCRVYVPKAAEAKRANAGGLVYIHGGGWCIGRPSEGRERGGMGQFGQIWERLNPKYGNLWYSKCAALRYLPSEKVQNRESPENRKLDLGLDFCQIRNSKFER